MTLYRNESSAKVEATRRQKLFDRPHYVIPHQNGFIVSDREEKNVIPANSDGEIALIIASLAMRFTNQLR